MWGGGPAWKPSGNVQDSSGKKKKKKDSLVRDFQALTFDLTLRKEAGVQAWLGLMC